MMLGVFMNTSSLWQKAFENNNYHKESKQRLITALNIFRGNVSVLANEIAKDLPAFTVHDISHIDSLWEMASIIAGDNIELNPIEAFVFGSAVLLHDLGMAAAAYVDGITSLQEGMEWEDALELSHRTILGRIPTEEERKSPPEEVIRVTIENRLRALHAIHAEGLPEMRWSTSDGNIYRLLEDQELLDDTGEVVGRIAASHWWPIERIESELNYIIASPPSYPVEWEIDVLKIACMLRTADASHIDKRRAPGFLRALRTPAGDSAEHWKFQNRLSRPTVKNNQLVYTSTRAFTERDMEAWWLAYDTVQMIDKELHEVDKLLKEYRQFSFEAKGVKGAENPNRLAAHIRVINWIPLDARIHVSDLPTLVKKLGGEALYGEKPSTTLRELIANACDAIEASKKMGGLEGREGKVTVRIGSDGDGQDWIEVEDNGIGITSRTMTNQLLDFGTSYWGSNKMLEEHPGLMSSGFKPIGKFGIGFFSVFMMSGKIRVVSRSIHKGPDETNILAFGEGLSKRPIIMKSKPTDRMKDAGTKVRVYLSNVNNLIDNIFRYESHSLNNNKVTMDWDISEKLEFICRRLAPCINADLYCQSYKNDSVRIIQASDWKFISSDELLLRICGFGNNVPDDLRLKATEYKNLLQPIYNLDGEIVGRAAISKESIYSDSDLQGIVTCGGLRVESIYRIFGVLLGNVTSASRNEGYPIVEEESLSKWATEQGELMVKELQVFKDTEIAATILVLGGNTGELPICETKDGLRNYNQLIEKVWPSKIFLIHDAVKSLSRIEELYDNVIAVSMGVPSVLENWPRKHWDRSIEELVKFAVLQSWGICNEDYINEYLREERTRSLEKVGMHAEGIEISEKVYIMIKK